MLKQLIAWGIFDKIPDSFRLIYKMYGELSPNNHVIPDYTDIGRVLISMNKPFKERKVMPNYLIQYLDMLQITMDIGMVVTLNILKDNIYNFNEVKVNLYNTLKNEQFILLNLLYTPDRIITLLNS